METRKIVLIWLVVGLVLVFFQIIIGGITRLTGSGLSITNWDIVTGVLPPLSETAWNEAFDLYKQTPQFQKINVDMNLGSIWESGSFKFIYFWEFLHRLWARSMGFIFIIPFLYFYFKKWLPVSLRCDLLLVVGLAGLAAVFGWMMVASGLVNRPWVNAYKLSVHLCIGFSVFGSLLWAFIKYLYLNKVVSVDQLVFSKRLVYVILGMVAVQLFLGGLMSGMKASLFYPTWPLIGKELVPNEIFDLSNWTIRSFIEYDSGSFVYSLVHFLHRSVAYGIVVLFLWSLFRNNILRRKDVFGFSGRVFGVFILVQVIIGIMTLIMSIGFIPVFWGVLHQAVAICVMSSLLIHVFYMRRSGEGQVSK